jgi:DNA polymerase alpha subunit A
MCVDHHDRPDDRPVSSSSLTLSAAKKKREDDTAKRDANDRDISDFFKKGVSKAPAKPKVS